ncbi:MAG: 4-hydroxy-tetrahydrodipicolinate reductase, partial [Betaproteobacteria bacterium]
MSIQHIAVAGSSGRMGRALIEVIAQSGDFRLKAALELAGNSFLGKDAGEFVGAPCGVPIRADVDKALAGCDVLVDFTRPEGTLAHVEVCRARGIRMVIGTTGFQPAQKALVVQASSEIPIVMAPNMSVGVNLT